MNNRWRGGVAACALGVVVALATQVQGQGLTDMKKGDKLVNTTIKTYPKVSQFWTYDEKWFLSQPVYSRDYPPLKS